MAEVVADSQTGILNVIVKSLFVINRSCILKGSIGVPTSKNKDNSNLASLESMHLVLLYLSIGHDSCY
jgi:hypothetical protein